MVALDEFPGSSSGGQKSLSRLCGALEECSAEILGHWELLSGRLEPFQLVGLRRSLLHLYGSHIQSTIRTCPILWYALTEDIRPSNAELGVSPATLGGQEVLAHRLLIVLWYAARSTVHGVEGNLDESVPSLCGWPEQPLRR